MPRKCLCGCGHRAVSEGERTGWGSEGPRGRAKRTEPGIDLHIDPGKKQERRARGGQRRGRLLLSPAGPTGPRPHFTGGSRAAVPGTWWWIQAPLVSQPSFCVLVLEFPVCLCAKPLIFCFLYLPRAIFSPRFSEWGRNDWAGAGLGPWFQHPWASLSCGPQLTSCPQSQQVGKARVVTPPFMSEETEAPAPPLP